MSDLLAKNIRKYRKQKKWTQKKLADEIEVSLMSIRRYETIGKDNREPSLDLLDKIASVLDTTTDVLRGKNKIICHDESINKAVSIAMQSSTQDSANNKDIEKMVLEELKKNGYEFRDVPKDPVSNLEAVEKWRDTTAKPQLISYYDSVNPAGKTKILEYAKDIAENPNYQRKDNK